MLIRVLGTLLIMAGSVGLGLYYSAKAGFRTQDLLEFKKALQILLSEIDYMRLTLADACKNTAARTSGGVGGIFGKFADSLAANTGETAYRQWLAAMETANDTTFFAAEDRNVIDDFGKTLGYLDINMQKNAIEYVIAYIDEKTTTLQAQSAKNKRMYRSLGIICGLLITVALW